MKTILDIISIPEVKVIFNLFKKEKNIYLVGGCIRNVLSGKEIDDIDFSIGIKPSEVIEILSKNRISFYDIGIKYGTVTALINNKKFEITSCREDIDTDGRHAKVQYTTDIKLDSLRRDFTINAIYVDCNGKIYDFHGGIGDIENRQLNFIGAPKDRIKEDYLRILRYFRFFGDFSDLKINLELKKILKEESINLNLVSKERIWNEFKKIINQSNSLSSLLFMQETNILNVISDQIILNEEYSKLMSIEKQINKPISFLLKLSILLDSSKVKVNNFLSVFSLNNEDAEKLSYLSELDFSIKSYLSIRESRKKLYRIGIENFQNLLILNWIKDQNIKNDLNWHALYEVAKSFEKPIFPFGAIDVIKMGIQEGPLVGKILVELEEWWIDNDFIEDEHSIFERLKAICLSNK